VQVNIDFDGESFKERGHRMVISQRFVGVIKIVCLLPICFAAVVVQKSATPPKAKVIKAEMQGKDYVRLLGGPPETFSLRSGAVTLRPGKTVGKHSTESYEELVVVLEGEGAMLLNEGQELPLKVGTVVYCPPDTEHDVKNTGSTMLKYIYVVAKAK
jgi:quercetin dioxygenase-like cupin family protein